MENKLNYSSVPNSFAHCFNDKCSNTDYCLRALAARQCVLGSHFINSLNPAFYPKEDKACPYFKKNEKIRLAWGISHLYDAIPFKNGNELKKRIISHFNKTHYYRIYRKELPITPSEQQYIKELFKQAGIKETPLFDSYTEEYDW